MVLASEHYDEKEYIRDYQAFLESVKAQDGFKILTNNMWGGIIIISLTLLHLHCSESFTYLTQRAILCEVATPIGNLNFLCFVSGEAVA